MQRFGTILEYLESRTLVSKVTNRNFESLGTGKSAYLGIDPTADGLHVGHLLGVMTLQKFQRFGFKPIALVGGATGMIGDPTGRSTERTFLSESDIEHNVRGLSRDLELLIDFSDSRNAAKLVNNYDWYKNMSSIDLLRDVGKHFRVNTMLSRECVQSRLGDNDGQHGLSFTEFAYQMLQGYDFLHLYKNENCRVQVGGSDQWGNIISGVDLIRRQAGATDAFGLTIPLLTTSSGEKIGKSAGNAVWIHPQKTSNFAFYQYFLRMEDDIVESLLLKMTDIPSNEIQDIMENHNKEPHKRTAQKILAETITKIVRGPEALSTAELVTNVLYGNASSVIPGNVLLELARDKSLPSTHANPEQVRNASVVDIAVLANVCTSKSQAKRLIESGGLYLNDTRIENPQERFDMNKHTLDNSVLLLRSGKKIFQILTIGN